MENNWILVVHDEKMDTNKVSVGDAKRQHNSSKIIYASDIWTWNNYQRSNSQTHENSYLRGCCSANRINWVGNKII